MKVFKAFAIVLALVVLLCVVLSNIQEDWINILGRFRTSKLPSCCGDELPSQSIALYPIAFIYGLTSGFSPCLIAVTGFIAAFTVEHTGSYSRALRRVTAIASGIFYAYLTLGLLSLSFLALADFVRQLAIVIGIILVLIAGLSFAEAAHDLYTRKWRQKKEAMLPIFRTPASIKNIIKEIALKNRLYFDFAIGALFSVIKLPCIAPLYLGISFYSDLRSFGFLTNLVAFDLGIVLPTLILGCLASTGLMSFSKLSTMRFAGRMIQRIVMGVALMGTAALILFQS